MECKPDGRKHIKLNTGAIAMSVAVAFSSLFTFWDEHDLWRNVYGILGIEHKAEDEGLMTNNEMGEVPVEVFKAQLIPEEIKKRMNGVSYSEEAPVKLEDLRYLNVTYIGFDGDSHVGELVVNERLADEVLDIFKELYVAGFQIEKIRLIDEYGANDNRSMADNNSSAFCFRNVDGSKSISKHSYGVAIDINPVQNPYIRTGSILPEQGKEYLDRKNVRKGMITAGDACYNAFKSRGWTWGGEWKSLKDYQHFEKKIEN